MSEKMATRTLPTLLTTLLPVHAFMRLQTYLQANGDFARDLEQITLQDGRSSNYRTEDPCASGTDADAKEAQRKSLFTERVKHKTLCQWNRSYCLGTRHNFAYFISYQVTPSAEALGTTQCVLWRGAVCHIRRKMCS